MIRPDDFEYALEQTRILHQPTSMIQTFGSTSFRFVIVSELMDEVNQVRIRDGKMVAERPRILSPHHYQKLLLEGFGEAAQDYADWLESQQSEMKILRYGFQLRKSDVREELVQSGKDAVLDRFLSEIEKEGDSKTALIDGVDDTWEVCLLRFTMDLIQRSAGENLDEWKRKGLL